MLAHQIDRGRGFACAGQQARRATHDFHAVVNADIEQRFPRRVARAPLQGHAVDLIIVDAKSACGKPVARTVKGSRGNAGGIVDHVGQGTDRLILHPLRSHHGYRLGRFLDRKTEAGGGIDFIFGGVGTGNEDYGVFVLRGIALFTVIGRGASALRLSRGRVRKGDSAESDGNQQGTRARGVRKTRKKSHSNPHF